MPRHNKGRKQPLPINPVSILQTIGLMQFQGNADIRVSVFVDVSLESMFLDFARSALRSSSESLKVSVTPYFDEVPKFNHGIDLAIVLAAKAPVTGRLLVQGLRDHVPTVAVTLDSDLLQSIAYEDHNEIDAASIITCKTGKNDADRFAILFDSLGSWIVAEITENQLSYARAFSFVKDAYVRKVIQSTSLQNAAIAAVFFLPGSDMPAMTLNQVKMFLQISMAYDAHLDQENLIKLGIILASGFGLRAIARRLLSSFPIASWVIRPAIGISATFALGVAVDKHFTSNLYAMQKQQGTVEQDRLIETAESHEKE